MKVVGLLCGLILLLLVGFFFFNKTQTLTSTDSPVQDFNKETEKNTAVEQAKILFDQKKEEGLDFSSGPCLSEEIIPGWSVDIAHDPRSAEDERAENQCAYYINKQTRHLVEMDLSGNFIRAL